MNYLVFSFFGFFVSFFRALFPLAMLNLLTNGNAECSSLLLHS